MKTEVDIRRLGDYLENIYVGDKNRFSDEGLDLKYKSVFEEDDEEPELFEGDRAYEVMGNLSIAIETLKWVLNESGAYRYPKDETDLKNNEHKVMYDGNGKEMIPDTSPETFMARIEGQW